MDMKLLIRSLLIFPGHVDKFFISAKNSDSDAIAIDLEDAVPEELKVQARNSIKSKLDSICESKTVFVRINGIDSGLMVADIEASVHHKLTGFILPMVQSADDIMYIDKIVSKLEEDNCLKRGKIKFLPLIEIASAVLNAQSIANASKRNIGLIFGHEDYLLNINGKQTKDKSNLLVPRTMIVMAARSIGGIPIDAPYLELSDMKGFSENALISKSLGFSGILAIHKNQVAAANIDYSPSKNDVNEAKEIIKQVNLDKPKGRSISFVNGRFVAPPILKWAKILLQQYDYFNGK